MTRDYDHFERGDEIVHLGTGARGRIVSRVNGPLARWVVQFWDITLTLKPHEIAHVDDMDRVAR